MYIKTVWQLCQAKGVAKTTDISVELDVAPSSVTEMILKLQEQGYLTHAAYKGCVLTPKGDELALKLVRKERLLRRFLLTVLKLPEDVAHDQACKLEHYIAPETEESICKLLGCPAVCPSDGQMIPRCADCMKLDETHGSSSS